MATLAKKEKDHQQKMQAKEEEHQREGRGQPREEGPGWGGPTNWSRARSGQGVAKR